MNLFYKESFLKPNIIKIVTMNDDWDFEKVNTKELTHGFHTYPAMMIPQVARKLINIYGKNAKTLLDPFMGSGTSLLNLQFQIILNKFGVLI
jgi:DNA modification methylase